MRHFYCKIDNAKTIVASSPATTLAGRLCFADSRIDNRQWLEQKLALNEENTDEQILLAAYLHWGKDCVRHLIGDFAFIIFDPEKQCVFCARDQMGVKPLFYSYNNHCFSAASNIKLLQQHCHTPLTLDKNELTRLVTTDIVMNGEYSDKTIYQNIRRLNPAHFMLIENKRSKQQRYWQLADKVINYKNEENYIEDFQALLKQAVACRINKNDSIACELSGGIDSSMTTAFAAKDTDNLIAFTHAANKESDYLDETSHAAALCKQANINKHVIIDDNNFDLFESAQTQIKNYYLPLRINNPLLSLSLIKGAQQQGCNVILSGFGGDECVSSHGAYLYKELCQQKKWRELWHELKAKHKKTVKAINIFTRQYLKTNFSTIERLAAKRRKKDEIDIKYLMLNASLNINETSLEKPTFDYPNIKQYEKSLLQGKNSWHLRQRIEGANLFANIYGIEYRFPLLDIRLLEFCLNLPAKLKRKNGWGRYLARKALQNYLPEELQWRADKAGSPVPAALYKSKENGMAKALVKQKVTSQKVAEFLDINSAVINQTDLDFYTFRNLINALQLQLLYDELEEIEA